MASSAAITAAFTVCILALSATSHAARPTGRGLLATSPSTAEGCTWSGSMCELNPVIALTINATDDKARLARKIGAMALECSTHNTNDTCNGDKTNNCAWVEDTSKCSVGQDWSTVLACPGTKSVEVMTCAEASAQADCEKITTCSWRVPNATELAAIREFMASMPESEVSGASLAQGGPSSRDTPTVIDPPAQDPAPDVEEEQLAPENLPIRETGECLPKDMTIVDYAKEAILIETGNYSEAIWGNCAGLELQKAALTTACSAPAEVECTANAACSWSPQDSLCEMGNPLVFYLTSSDSEGDFDKAMEKVVAACAAAGANRTLCTQEANANKGTIIEDPVEVPPEAEDVPSNKTADVKNDATAVSRTFALLLVPLIAAVMMSA